MAEDQYQHTVDGQEVDEADLNLLAQGARSVDRLLAEILRLSPYLGTVSRAIVPTGAGPYLGTIRSSGTTDGSVRAYPFRAVIGSRTPVSATPGSALDAWRDIRSSVYAVSDDASTLGHRVAFAANPTGNARWDGIYATFTVDAPGGIVNRYVKPAVASAPVVTSIATRIVQSVVIATVLGTPSATPALPAVPADPGGGVYNIPIAYVRIPAGFTTSSAILATDIYDVAPVVPIARALGARSIVPASSNSVLSAAAVAAWANTGTRTNHCIPSTLVGSEAIQFGLDVSSSTSSNWSHAATNALVDNSRDWRKRAFKWSAQFIGSGGGGALFAWNGGSSAPIGSVTFSVAHGFGQSHVIDGGGTASLVARLTPGLLSDMAVTTQIDIFVDQATGQMFCTTSGIPKGLLYIWIEASAPFANAS
jgi:hypothetical protein